MTDMISYRIAIAIVILVFVIHFAHSRWSDFGDPDCDIRPWSSWSSCDYPCGTTGNQTRYKVCNDLRESRRCSGTLPVDCELSSWSEWKGSCSRLTADRCAFSRNQTSTRYKSRAEGCGGTCQDVKYEKSRQCECFNGGTPFPNGTCQCKEDFDGACCEDVKNQWQKGWLGFLALLIFFCCFYACCKDDSTVAPQ